MNGVSKKPGSVSYKINFIEKNKQKIKEIKDKQQDSTSKPHVQGLKKV